MEPTPNPLSTECLTNGISNSDKIPEGPKVAADINLSVRNDTAVWEDPAQPLTILDDPKYLIKSIDDSFWILKKNIKEAKFTNAV